MSNHRRQRKASKCKKPKLKRKPRRKSKSRRKYRSKTPPDRPTITVAKERFCVRKYEQCHDKFLSYKEIQQFLCNLQNNYQKRVRVEEIGKSRQERSIMMVTISEPSAKPTSDKPKLVTFIEAGSVGRDWLSVSSALILIDYVAKNSSSTKLMDYMVIPCSNPDAYENSLCKGEKNSNVSMNLSQNTPIFLGLEDIKCIPNDIFMCAVQLWKNSYSFKAPETEAVLNAIQKNRVAIRLFISFQEGGEKIVYPFGCCSQLPVDVEDLRTTARKGQSGICYRCFEIGNIYDVCGLTFGTLVDLFRLQYGMKFVYILHMNDRNKVPDTKHIIPYGMDMVKCVKMMIASVYVYFNRFETNKKCEA